MKRFYLAAIMILTFSVFAQAQDYLLTMQTDPPLVPTISPAAGEHTVGGSIEIQAQPFISCPHIYEFAYWLGDVADPNSAATTVLMDSDKTVRAVYALAEPRCGDACHPNFTAGDLNHDCIVDLADFSILASRWLNCTHPNCDGMADYLPPKPNPAQWQVEPVLTDSDMVHMEAVPAADTSGVEYRFVCFEIEGLSSEWMQNVASGDPGYTEIPWIYEVSGLDVGVYSFYVKTRDRSLAQNETAPSAPVSVSIDGGDTDPPLPNPAQWEIQPTAVPGTFDMIQMSAVQHHDQYWPDEELEYYFDCVNPSSGPDSGWTSNREFSVSRLLPGSYLYVVRVRDPLGNTTANSPAVSVTPGENTQLPLAQWFRSPFVVNGQLAVSMEAVAYEDYFSVLGINLPNLPQGFVMKYQFDYTGSAAGGDDRLFEASPVYTDTGVVQGQTYPYRVRMGLFYEPGNGSSIMLTYGSWSVIASVTVIINDTDPPLPNPARHANDFPYAVFDNDGQWYHIVVAVEATDDSDVEYRFVCSQPQFSSGGSLGNGPVWRNADNVGEGDEADPKDLYYPNPSAYEEQIQVPYEYRVRTYLKQRSYTWFIITRDRTPAQNETWHLAVIGEGGGTANTSAPANLPDLNDPDYQTVLNTVNAQVKSITNP